MYTYVQKQSKTSATGIFCCMHFAPDSDSLFVFSFIFIVGFVFNIALYFYFLSAASMLLHHGDIALYEQNINIIIKIFCAYLDTCFVVVVVVVVVAAVVVVFKHLGLFEIHENVLYCDIARLWMTVSNILLYAADMKLICRIELSDTQESLLPVALFTGIMYRTTKYLECAQGSNKNIIFREIQINPRCRRFF
jgi:hypothetical protein